MKILAFVFPKCQGANKAHFKEVLRQDIDFPPYEAGQLNTGNTAEDTPTYLQYIVYKRS